MAIDWSATVSVPARADASALLETVKAAVPFPVPVAPLVTVSQPASARALHAHAAAVVTVAIPVPPEAVNDVGEAVTV
jgi:hypothetical protein